MGSQPGLDDRPGSIPGITGSLPGINSRVCPTCFGRFPADFRVCPRDAVPLDDAPDDEDPLIGQLLAGSYEVNRVLGEGGMGRVYEARHTRLGNKRFAVKVLHHELARQPEVVTRFQREAEAAAVLTHANVVGVFDVNIAPDGRPYIVAELLEGHQLGEYLERRSKLSVVEAVHIVRQVCRALAAAHAAGIVHRDVKPENVFLTANGVVKVLDFGISRVAENSSLTKTGTVMGTPDYMPPEQARGDRVDARADVYAVGAILYRALTGRKPFQGLDPMATLTAVLTEEPPRPTALEPSIPLPLELIVQRAMAKKPSDRYASMDELDEELSAFDDPEAVSQAVPISSVAVTTAADAMAKTLLPGLTPPSKVMTPMSRATTASHTMAATARSVRLARPGLVFFTGLGVVWVYLNAMIAAASIIRLVRGTDLTQSEVTLALIGVSTALLTPFVLWVRHLKREVWPNTPRAIEAVSRMRRTVLYSATSYGLSAALVQMFEGIVARNGAGVARPGWAIFAFEVSLVVGAVTWITTRKRKTS